MSEEIRVADLTGAEMVRLEGVLDSYHVPYTEQRVPAQPGDLAKIIVIKAGAFAAMWAAKALYEYVRMGRRDVTLEEAVEEHGKKTTRKIRIMASQAPAGEVRKEIGDFLAVDPESIMMLRGWRMRKVPRSTRIDHCRCSHGRRIIGSEVLRRRVDSGRGLREDFLRGGIS